MIKFIKSNQNIVNVEFSNKPVLPFEFFISLKQLNIKFQTTDIDNLEYKATIDYYSGNEYYNLCYKRKIYNIFYNKETKRINFKKEIEYVPFGVY